ncbi:hypothetical protein Dimus_039704 [Dionaea muscipula]
MTNDGAALDKSVPYTGTQWVYVGNAQSLPITHIGSISSLIASHPLKTTNVLLVPHITKNLLSISKLTRKNNCSVTFSSSGFTIQDLTARTVVEVGRCEKGLYILDRGHHGLLSRLSKTNVCASSVLWHARLGHPSPRIVSSLQNNGVLSFSDNGKPVVQSCFGCQLGKSHRLPFQHSSERCTSLFDRIHCDLWGPSPIISPSGYRYYCVLIDDFSRFNWIFLLKQKSDFYDTFVNFYKYVTTQFDHKIKSFQCDGGTEFTNHRFTSFLRHQGITQRIACPYTPSQNGLAERKHRHITETGLTMMFHSHAPLLLWVESFSTTCYLINRLPSPVLSGKSPHELLYGKLLTYSLLRTFGCLCFPFLRDYMPHKLTPRSLPCVFLGYSPLHKGFRCLDKTTNRVYVSRHIQFFRTIFLLPIRHYPRSKAWIMSRSQIHVTSLPQILSPKLLAHCPHRHPHKLLVSLVMINRLHNLLLWLSHHYPHRSRNPLLWLLPTFTDSCDLSPPDIIT